MDDSHASSVDPLALSHENVPITSPSKPKRPSISPRKPLTSSSGNARIQEFYVSTPPTKSRGTSPVKGQITNDELESPWRIRVTVQAERAEECGVDVSSEKPRERTTTTIIPLKGGEDESIITKRGRGRPRKSSDTQSKRKGTPKPKAVPRRWTAPELEESSFDDIWAPTPLKKNKVIGKNVLTQDKQSHMSEHVASPTRSPNRSTPTRTVKARPFSRSRSRSRRKEITPKKRGKTLDVESEASLAETPSRVIEPREVIGPSEASAKDSTATRISEVDFVPAHMQLPDPDLPCNGTQSSVLERSTQDFEDENMWRRMIRHDSISPDPESDHCEDGEDVDASPDPTEDHHEYDTILESEGFSMVSVESLKSTGSRQASQSPSISQATPVRGIAGHPRPSSSGYHDEPEVILQKELEGYAPVESDNSLEKTPLEPDNKVAEAQTPQAVHITPAQPAPPQQPAPESTDRIVNDPSDGTPKFDRVVRAGTVLQSVPSPDQVPNEQRKSRLASPFDATAESPVQHRDGGSPSRQIASTSNGEKPSIFGGFSAATQRELKAGLRLGEELGKRQPANLSIFNVNTKHTIPEPQSSPPHPSIAASDHEQTSTPERADVSYPDLSNTQLPSPARTDYDDEDRMSWKADTSLSHTGRIPMQETPVQRVEHTSAHYSYMDQTMFLREAQWQREREAVSKQIREANASQVIVIDSDGEDSPSSNVGQSLSESEGSISDDAFNVTEGTLLPDVLKAETVKLEPARHRRSKLPSPWRREASQVSTQVSSHNESDLFWQPDSVQTEAEKRREERKKQKELSESLSEQSAFSSNIGIRRSAKPIRVTDHDISQITSRIEDGSFSLDSNITNESPEAATDETTISLPLDEEPAASIPLPQSPSIGRIDPALLTFDPELEAAVDSKLTQRIEEPPLPPSWLSTFTAPLKYIFAAKPTLPPATVEEILTSSMPEPLSMLLPMTEAHHKALEPLCSVSWHYNSNLLPYNPNSVSVSLLGGTMTTARGWSRTITQADCGIIDGFLILLRERGIKPPHGQDHCPYQRIKCIEIACSIVQIWSQHVMRGDIKLKAFKGARAGLRRQGDKTWTERDIDPKKSLKGYLEEKRRQIEVDGMPSWKEAGMKGPFDLRCVRGQRKDDRFYEQKFVAKPTITWFA